MGGALLGAFDVPEGILQLDPVYEYEEYDTQGEYVLPVMMLLVVNMSYKLIDESQKGWANLTLLGVKMCLVLC